MALLESNSSWLRVNHVPNLAVKLVNGSFIVWLCQIVPCFEKCSTLRMHSRRSIQFPRSEAFLLTSAFSSNYFAGNKNGPETTPVSPDIGP
jgi:hypothetical protein